MRDKLRESRRVILSSYAALADLTEFAGAGAAEKCRVLQFVSQPRLAYSAVPPLAALPSEYSLPSRFFLLPNQFWRHKNHAVVIEALRLADDPDLVVLATGPNVDYRHPHHYSELMARVATLGLSARFRHLGVVPFAHLMSLMKHAVAVINPSYFEGWSTTVEESKSLGKRILLSDIDVHREQQPERGRYFPADDARALAALLTEAWHTHDEAADLAAAKLAAERLPARTQAFGAAYQNIVLESV